MVYNWKALTNNDIAGLIRNGGIVSGYDADFNRELVEETSRRIERAAQLEAERDEARAALVRYQDERARLLSRIEELAARVKELEDSDASFSRDLSEALNLGDGVYRP